MGLRSGALRLAAALLLAGSVVFAAAETATSTPSSASPSPLPRAHGHFSTDWRVFGPLPLGGVGADALTALPGTLLSVLKTVKRFPSETANGGYAKWSTAAWNASTGTMTAFFNMSAPPLTAWAVSELVVFPEPAQKGVVGSTTTLIAFRCSRAAYVVRASTKPGEKDAVHHCTSTDAPCTLLLPPGRHALYVHAVAWGPTASVKCVVDREVTVPALLPMPGVVRPSAIVHAGAVRLAGAHAAVVLHNADAENWAAAGVVRVQSDPPGIVLATASLHPPRLAPEQTRAIRLDLDDGRLGGLKAGSKIRVEVEVEYQVAGQQRSATFSFHVPVLAWPAKVYDATYVDADGSVQAVALRPPLEKCKDGCSTLLSTHGAGVDALGNAWTGAYATQRGAWVLLPTGRRRYGDNWEGAMLSSALRCLRVFGERAPGVPESEREGFAIRKDWVMFSGHSMGGHGALVLATHHPDLMVAALPISGWLRYGTYGRDGDAFRPQLPFSDAGLRAIFDLSVAEYATDLYSENVLGIPLTARVGSIDSSVPPTNLRKFCRLVREYELYNNLTNSFVTLNEVPGKGHWFTGVMDDAFLQPYLDSALTSTSKPILPPSFSLFSINPATSGSRGGLRIMQLSTPFESARISVKIQPATPDTWTITTRNVRRFRYRGINGVHPRPHFLQIEGNDYSLPIPYSIHSRTDTSASYVDFCIVSPSTTDVSFRKWTACPDRKFPLPDALERGPDTSGPLTQVITGRRLVVVYPADDQNLLGVAVRYANSLYSRGIGASITPDSAAVELMRSGLANMVVLGGARENSVTRALQQAGRSAAVRTAAGLICVGERCTQRPGAGIAFLAPGPQRSLVVVIAGTDRAGFDAAASFLPESAEQRIPEWVLVQAGDGFGWRGYGAVQAAGYWDRLWRLDAARTYPAEWAVAAKEVVHRRNPARFLLILVAIGISFVLLRLVFQFCRTRYIRNTYVNPNKVNVDDNREALLPDGEGSREMGVQ